MYEFRCEIYEPEDEVIDLPDGLTDQEGVDVDDSQYNRTDYNPYRWRKIHRKMQ